MEYRKKKKQGSNISNSKNPDPKTVVPSPNGNSHSESSSVSKKIAFAVTVSWVSRGLTILANLFLIPIMFRYMGKEELGLWFLLNNSQSFLSLLGLGIAPTLMRHIAFAKGKSGGATDAELTEESKRHIGDLVVTGRTILQVLAIVVFFVAWISGYGIIGQLQLKDVSPQIVFWSWTLMCAGYAIGVWVSYLDCWLAGIGYVGWNSIIITGVSFATIVVNVVAIIMGGGILTLAAITVVAGLFQRFAIWMFIRWKQPQMLDIQGKWNSKYARNLVKPSLYTWLTGIGSFLILRTDDYFIAFLGNIKDIPAYRASYQFVSTLYMLVAPIAGSSSVFISQMWQDQKLNDIHRLVIRNARITLCVMGSGVAFVLTAGKEFLEMWLGNGNFIGYPILIVFSVTMTLVAQHNALLVSARATEDEKYVASSLASGLINIVFTSVLIRPFGLLGVALATMLGQMLTNNWYMVYRPIVRLKIGFKNYFDKVVILAGLNFVLSLVFSRLVNVAISYTFGYSMMTSTISSFCVCLSMLCFFVWFKVFDIDERSKIKNKIKIK
jgi:O-antigen/teichoic acid export membrane protein